MNNQEVFNKVWNHFVVNKSSPSVNVKGGCFYRGPNNTKCAAGVLIPDDLYSPTMEGITFYSLLRGYPALKKYFNGCNGLLIRQMQLCHDGVAQTYWDDPAFYTHMEYELRKIAVNCDLAIPTTNKV